MADTFEVLWERFLNAPKYGGDISDNQMRVDLLKRCLKTATSVDHAVSVFNVTKNDVVFDRIPSLALSRMIELASTETEAERVYALASQKQHRGSKQYRYPAREKEAKLKLESFTKQQA